MTKKSARRKSITAKDSKEYGQVLLTDKQYNTLINTYGEDLTLLAIRLLNDKINSNRFNKKLIKAKNHYQYFRRDGRILNFALDILNTAGACGTVHY